MLISDLICPGDKVDIKLTYQVERQQNGEDIEVKLYKSSVMDLLSENSMELSMPTESGRMVLFQIGLRCEAVVYTGKGMYKVNAVARERYKKDNLYMLVMDILDEPVKFQRREFFRISYVSDMKYYRVTPEIADLQTTEELFVAVHNPDKKLPQYHGIIQDISGGGIKFASEYSEKAGSYIVIELRLVNSKFDETFYLLCRIVEGDLRNEAVDKVSNRAKFIYKDLKDRETIVRFVFEEERRIRKKVSG